MERCERMSTIEVEVRQTPAAACVPIDRPRMSLEEAAATAAVFKALSDPARVRIVNLLASTSEPLCVCHLTGPLGLSQATVSFHMKKLMDAGLLEREQRGVWAYYSLRDDANRRLSAILNLRRRRTMTELRERPGRGSMTRGAPGLLASEDAWPPLLSFGEVAHCKVGEPHINEAAAMSLVLLDIG
jgi:ArsR family transcriptional regulator, arsenate/arsenite/antimonite-responsive transcriptional repressor